MKSRLLIVVGIPILVGAVVAIPLGLALGSKQWTFAGIAFALCVPPGLAIVVLHDYLIQTSPFGRILAMAIGTFVRLVTGFGGGVVVWFLLGLDERSDKLAYWIWILFAYLTTLLVELIVLTKPHAVPR